MIITTTSVLKETHEGKSIIKISPSHSRRRPPINYRRPINTYFSSRVAVTAAIFPFLCRITLLAPLVATRRINPFMRLSKFCQITRVQIHTDRIWLGLFRTTRATRWRTEDRWERGIKAPTVMSSFRRLRALASPSETPSFFAHKSRSKPRRRGNA